MRLPVPHEEGLYQVSSIFSLLLACRVKVDPVVDAAAKASGLDIGEIKSYLPAGLTIWIDPREVSCRLTENGPVKVIYRGGGGGVGTLDQTQGTLCNVDGDEMTPDRELQRVNWGYDPSPSPGWSSTGGSGSGASPVAGGTARVLHPPPPNTTCFTAATFAQTKFGSTKMKSQTGPQRPNRLSPIESLPTGFTPRLSPSSGCWGLSPTSGLSPTVGTNRLSPMQQSPTVQFGMLSTAGGGDARLAGLQEWLLLQHHQHQQVCQVFCCTVKSFKFLFVLCFITLQFVVFITVCTSVWPLVVLLIGE